MKPFASKRVVRGVLLSLIVCVLLAGARATALDFYRVGGGSMRPTLLPGDLVLANKTAFGLRLPFLGFVTDGTPPTYGEIIVLQLRYRKRRLIKRVVALPGDTVAMRAGQLHINGELVSEPYLHELSGETKQGKPPENWHFSYLIPEQQNHQYKPTGAEWGPLVVPAERYFVLGDNRDASGDSRGFGFVHAEELIARPLCVL